MLDLASELHAHHPTSMRVDVLSSVPIDVRQAELLDHEALGSIELSFLVGDVTRRAVITRHLANDYDRIVLVASDWLATGAQSDARTVLTYMLVRDELTRLGRSTPLVLELMDAANRSLILDEDTQVMVSPLVIGRLLAHVSLRRELRAVYDDLFDADGPSVQLRTATLRGDTDAKPTFAQVSRLLERDRDVLLGWVDGAGYLSLNPDDDALWPGDGTELVVLGRLPG